MKLTECEIEREAQELCRKRLLRGVGPKRVTEQDRAYARAVLEALNRFAAKIATITPAGRAALERRSDDA